MAEAGLQTELNSEVQKQSVVTNPNEMAADNVDAVQQSSKSLAGEKDVTEEVLDKLQGINIDSPKSDYQTDVESNIQKVKTDTEKDVIEKTETSSETIQSDTVEANPDRVVTTTDNTEKRLDSQAVKLKSSLAQKSKNLSAKDKEKIAEMVKGLAKFKHAEEDVHIDTTQKKGKKEKKCKEVPVKKTAEMKDDDTWEDIDSEEERTDKHGMKENVDIQIHVGDKRTVTADTAKPQRTTKIGSYTQLLQAVGGRKLDSGTGSQKKNKSTAEGRGNQLDPSRQSAKVSGKEKQSEGHQSKKQNLSQQSGGSPGAHGKDTEPDLGDVPLKMSHKQQAKLRSEMFKLQQQNQSPQSVVDLDMKAAGMIKGRVFQRSDLDEAAVFVSPAAEYLIGGEGMLPEKMTMTEKDKQSLESKGKKNKGKKKQDVAEYIVEHSSKETTSPREEPPGAETSEVRVKVNKSDHRFIVGQQRKNIVEIFNLTGVTIEVPKVNDPSEEVILRGDKFQIGSAITLMYTKCEVSRAMSEQKTKEKELQQLQLEMAPMVKGQGQMKQDRTEKGQGDYLNINQNANRGLGRSRGNSGAISKSGMPYQFPVQSQSYQSQSSVGLEQRYMHDSQRKGPQNQRQKSGGQEPGQQKKKGKSQGQRQGQNVQGYRNGMEGQGQATKGQKQKQIQKDRQKKKGNRDKLKIYKVRLVMAQPLMFDGTWLQQGKYESAEARYQKFLAGTLQSQVSQPPLFGGTCTLPHLGKSESETRNQQVIAETVQLQVVEPLLFDGTWLQQGKYESAEAHYQQILAGTTTCRSQRKNVHVRKKVFEPYLSIEEVSRGLKRGILIEGPIRINPKNYEEAYVPHPDGKSDILICSFVERNRALNGDVVAILLKQEGDWKLNKEELQLLEEIHGLVEEPLRGGNSESVDDADADVKIESEEVIVMENCDNETSIGNGGNMDTDSKKNTDAVDSTKQGLAESESQTQKQNKGGNKTPNKAMQRYTSLSDVLNDGSPAAKRLFSCGGDENRTEVLEKARKLLVRTGKVVAVIEKKHSRACTGTIRPLQDKNPNRALFAPSDYRLPRLLIPMDDCPKGLLDRPEDFARTLYVARITDWKEDSKMAFGKLARSLGEAGEIEPETEGMLIENGVDFEEFPQQALDCLPQNLPWCIPETEFEYRRDFRDSCIFTIDPATARDLDDALSCEALGNGMFKVGVHIADVSWFINEGSVLDRVASLRATSVYLVHKVIPMLPRLLCEQLCSLNPDEDRLAFSVEWTISESGEIEDEWFGRSVIRSCVKLSYDHAQGFIDQPERDWTQEELPNISEKYTVDDIKTRVLNLHKIARNLRKGRFDGGCLRLDQIKLQYSLDSETGLPNGYWVYQQKESNSLVEEFMLLANMAVAHRINNFYPDKALLRRHPPPQEKMLENLKDQCSALGLHLDTSGAGELQRSLWRYFDDDEYSLARMQVLVSLCSKPMQNAKYFCTGCIDDETLYRHYALNVPLYTHFTSPIRRYPDVIVHRLLGATLDYCDEPKRSPQELHKIAEHCNDKKTAAKRCSDLSSELFFAVFVKVAGPLEEKAMVMAVFDKAFDIFILRLGVTKRVYCDKLDIKDKIYSKDKKVPSLTLIWSVNEGEAEDRQIITIFTVVDCILKQGDLPLQWMAVIKRREKTDFVKHLETHDHEDITGENESSDHEDLCVENIKEEAHVDTDELQQEETVTEEQDEQDCDDSVQIETETQEHLS